MNRDTNQIRQGDVFLVRVDADVPETATQVPPVNGRLILAWGEATGHHHSVAAADAELFQVGDGAATALGVDMLLRVRSRTTVLHPEHHRPDIGKVAELEPGTYRVIRPKEYQPKAAPRPVAD